MSLRGAGHLHKDSTRNSECDFQSWFYDEEIRFSWGVIPFFFFLNDVGIVFTKLLQNCLIPFVQLIQV